MLRIFALLVALATTGSVGLDRTVASPGSSALTPTATANLAHPDLGEWIKRFASDRESLTRTFNAPNSPAAWDRLQDFYAEWQKRLESIDFNALNQDGQIDYVLFQGYLKRARRQIELRKKQTAEMASLLPFAKTILALEDARRQMETPKPDEAAATLHQITKEIGKIREAEEAGLKAEENSSGTAVQKIQPSRASKVVARRASTATVQLREVLKKWFANYNGYDPQFTWWAAEPYKEADQALEGYAKFLTEKLVGIKADDKTTIIGDPVGREAIQAELTEAIIPYTPEELIAIAKNEMAWCTEEMKRASRQMGFGDDWHQALEKVKQMHVEPGRQPEEIRKLALEAIDFVEKNNLVTVPDLAKETWRMEMMSPERQLINPFFTGGEVISVSYPTDTMTYEQKLMSMRGNNIPFSRSTVFHELIPGHYLQQFMTERYRSYRKLFGTPFWGEGNAFYWELLFWDMGFPRTPEERVGMLFWRMHRCARVIFSLSFHLGLMTPQQCVDFLVKNGGHELDNATAEVRRSFDGSDGPLYQCAYLLGALQFRALHKELVESGKMTNRAFHDAILQENSIPVEMIRVDLTHQKLTQKFQASWKFYGPIAAAAN